MNLKSLLFSALIFSCLLPSCGNDTDTSLRLGYLQSDLHHLPAFVAIEKGFFTDQGVQVKVTGIFKAGPEEMSAFGAGELDIGYVGQSPATAALLNGVADIMFVAQVNLEGSSIVTRKSAGISTLADLRGRSVAIPGHATMQDFLLRKALGSSSLRFEDIRSIVLKPPEMLQALEQGNIDAFIAWQPYPEQALTTGAAAVLADSSAIWKGHPCCVLIAQRELCRKAPELIRKIRAAHDTACAYIRDNEAEAIAIGMKYTGMSRDIVSAALRRITYTPVIDPQKGGQFVAFLEQLRYIQSRDAEKRFLQAFFE